MLWNRRAVETAELLLSPAIAPMSCPRAAQNRSCELTTARAAQYQSLASDREGEGRGLGYGFAWLPCGAEGVAQGLAAAGRLSYELRGETQVALVRPARGHQRGRAAPNSQPVFTCLEVTALTDVPQELVCAAAMRWQSFLEPWGVGLAFRHHPLEQMVIKPGEGIVVLGFSNGLSLLPSLLSRAKESGAPVLVLVEEGEAPVSAVVSGVDVLCWKDVGEDRGAGLVFSAVRRCVHWQLSRRLKVFVCDCDQTLWGGVVAEDGVEELDLEGPFRVLQEKVVRLQELGRLICLASRNQEEDVLKVFEQREMPLKREHLAAWQVHWGSKVLSLRRLASELRLGLEAFVFLDDNPAEVEAVRRALPQVICVSIPADADAFHRLLQTHWALDLWTNTGTAEDAQRTQMPRDPPTGPWSVTVLGGADSFWFGGMQSLAEAGLKKQQENVEMKLLKSCLSDISILGKGVLQGAGTLERAISQFSYQP
ncbi:Hypothetical protein (Fragment) [Durusdinium trenchii]|uniref:Uncharacterized protein n=1 Tax=Durusdinium trenchii TaxID=1381693 RepID=A0ABP0HUP1_9DINO